MALDRFELLELRRDDGVQTYHAREVSTARPVQVHFLANARTPENMALLSRLDHLPEAERRRVIDRGQAGERPYIVTERLAGFAGLREWLETKGPVVVDHAALDRQILSLFESTGGVFEPSQGLIGPGGFAPANPEHAEIHEPPPTAKSLLWIAGGVAAALLFIIFVIAVIAFRPH